MNSNAYKAGVEAHLSGEKSYNNPYRKKDIEELEQQWEDRFYDSMFKDLNNNESD